MSHKHLWGILGLVMGLSFAVLLYYGGEIYQQAPPVPREVVTMGGEVVMTGSDIRDGQNVWQSMGGHELGSIWGHGSYVAPDWTADWVHREARFMLDIMAGAGHGARFDELGDEQKETLKAQLSKVLRPNTYDARSGVLSIAPERAQAFRALSDHYAGLFNDDPSLAELREAYAIPRGAVKDPERLRALSAFFFWTAWTSTTERPGKVVTYTNNWPPDELVGNRPTADLVLWTGFSVIMLLLGIGLLGVYYAARPAGGAATAMPEKDPLLGLQRTPSMGATLKYFWVVAGLLVLQVILGAVTAHYGVEGNGFYGLALADWLPYSVTRTWHVQTGIFWIATSWLATGLYLAPAIAGREPPWQRAGVNVLFLALLIVVLGSLAGQWAGIMQHLGLAENFWFGHQGYEYVDLGRFWQILLFVGLLLWLALVARALLPALREKSAQRPLIVMFALSAAAIALFYGAGLMWGQHSNLAVVEYWRWWVVHLWVEGFFEVFATVVIAFLFVRMELLHPSRAIAGALFATIVYLSGGILGTFHHLYFTGTPMPVLAVGATFSALEVAPLVLMGFDAYHNWRLSKSKDWLAGYRWPIYCFIAVAFWNLIGAGIFGFLINPPIALYYMQGLNTTPVHGHTALFGVYGMLGIGLMLFVLKGLSGNRPWKGRVLSFAFWSINIGLLLMVLLSVLPLGLLQTVASVREGLWYARSAEFLQSDSLDVIRWLRVIGDTIFALGAVALGYFVIGLKTGWSLERD